MPFQVSQSQRTFAFRPEPVAVWRLQGAEPDCCAEIATDMGCNVFHWTVPGPSGKRALLFADPEVFPGGRPTRSGIPILFPYPNRLRGGSFEWRGKTYQTPLTDASGKHSIHGFACRRPWRVLDSGAAADHAWLTAEFRASLDAPENLPQWPGDYALALTFRLFSSRLRIEASVTNPGTGELPFGLGFHPYFQLEEPNAPVHAPAKAFWQLVDSLPTGQILPVDANRDVNQPRPASELTLDDVLTDLPGEPTNAEGLVFRGGVGAVSLWTTAAFRELVAFTPAHRQAVCLEPYTCTTDAVHLQARGISAGWLTLAAGQTWKGVFEMAVDAR